MTEPDRNLAGYDHPRCYVCDGRLRLTDSTADRRVLDADGGTRVVRAHRACLKEGVERWCRLNRPHSGPLAASRLDGWTWHAEPPVRLDG